MHKRAKSPDRFRLLLIVALLSLIALGSFWMLEVIRRNSVTGSSAARNEDPDYFVEKFTYVKMTGNGRPRYHLTGAKLTHLPSDDSYEIEQPVMDSFNNPDSPISMRAERATANHDGSNIHMISHVQIDRPQTATSDPLHVDTEYLLILPNDDVMQTDKAVGITLGASIMNGVGMTLDNATRKFRIDKLAHIIYRTKPSASAHR